MKPPEDIKREFVRQWLEKADTDLGMARHLLQGRSSFAFGAAFHAQQAAEKALKALLVWRGLPFPKTHDIRRLVDLIEWPEGSAPASIQKAFGLSIFASEYRYPSDLPAVTLVEAREALQWAEEVRGEVVKRLPPEFGGGE